ncbi:MAG TPA: hypothetical protein VG673_23535, partial [Actinomycetota bacterium]|nr:hypothetical protein [Actinomycetota bacterium]
ANASTPAAATAEATITVAIEPSHAGRQAGRPACHSRAIPGGLQRRLAVTHGHSVHFDLRSLFYRWGPHEW